MKNVAKQVLTSVPPYVLFFLGFACALTYGLLKLYAIVKDAGVAH